MYIPGVEVSDLPDEPREVLFVGAVHDHSRSAVVAHHLHPGLDGARRGDLYKGRAGLRLVNGEMIFSEEKPIALEYLCFV